MTDSTRSGQTSRVRRQKLLAAALEAIPINPLDEDSEEARAYNRLFALGSEEDLQFLMTRRMSLLIRRWRKELDDKLRRMGQSLARWEAMFHLSVNKSKSTSTLTELSQRMGVTGPTLVNLLASLEREGLIQRTLDEEDRRSRLIEVTPLGERITEKMRDVTTSMRRMFFEGLSDSEIQITLDVVGTMLENLERIHLTTFDEAE